MEWVILDIAKGEVQQSLQNVTIRIQKVPLQAFLGVPVGSVPARLCNVKF